MAEIPTFYARIHPDDPRELILDGIKHEWEHIEDHDAVLRELEPIAKSFVGEFMNDRMFDLLEALIQNRLYHMLRAEQIYTSLGRNQWVLADRAKLRHEARKLELESKYPWLKR